ncbi:hypothetical protein POSPLADRAFT_1135970 [Postia placenta MAD-698-R-SB12]|uniref:Uncharacterized protein n=1 Tax=Postia placenta MAD-698-R-SB12 TaxID=670580 RepID=A0A1X6N9U2_9APHY|nr:hypothetical protein POSPLADRAFT_1135970 [Postia placenta MAD-698-R-SB12]OSX65334.1 hypothetical protein POSPLADRAFT_1135970 [Postia placenta MAD-698-R-SB12]
MGSTNSKSAHKSNKLNPQPTLASNNYEAQPEKEDSSSEKHGTKSTSAKQKDAEPSHKPQSAIVADVNADAALGTGLSAANPSASVISVYSGLLPEIPPSTLRGTPTPTPGFSPLPPFASFAASTVISSLSVVSSRTFPTPSLPILQDVFPARNPKDDEESLFGGKERLSGNNGLWTWTTYSRPASAKPELAAPEGQNYAFTNTSERGWQQLKEPPMGANEKTMQANMGSRVPPRSVPSVQEATGTIPRGARRVSAMSMSIYPGSPQSTQGIGIAIGGASPLTADGMPVLQRNVSKASTRRVSTRRSVRYSVQGKRPGIDSGDVDVYDGLRITSPVTASPATVHKKSSSVQGRARVKAPYAPAALLRTSTSAAAYSGVSNPFDDSQYVLPAFSPALKSDALRERDTRALTTALGLASPVPPSPQPTLYPDDSITLAGGRSENHPASKPRPQSQSLSPGMEASARLGNLMLAEFSSMQSLPSARASGDGTVGVLRKTSSKKRAEDKPPRVPSPPPLPSLAQMALSHTNPDAYTDYRSPTYSIYGLYEADRKSRAPGEGGY